MSVIFGQALSPEQPRALNKLAAVRTDRRQPDLKLFLVRGLSTAAPSAIGTIRQ